GRADALTSPPSRAWPGTPGQARGLSGFRRGYNRTKDRHDSLQRPASRTAPPRTPTPPRRTTARRTTPGRAAAGRAHAGRGPFLRGPDGRQLGSRLPGRTRVRRTGAAAVDRGL